MIHSLYFLPKIRLLSHDHASFARAVPILFSLYIVFPFLGRDSNPSDRADHARVKRKYWQPFSVPDASSSVVRDTLVLLLLQCLHGIVQKEIDQNRVDSVRLRLLVDTSVMGSSNAFCASSLHFWMPFFNFSPDQLHTPDTRAAELNFPL